MAGDGLIYSVWNERKGIAAVVKGCYEWCRDHLSKTEGILVIGPGGTGKTTLSQILKGEYNFLLDSGRSYQESVGVESVKIKGSPNVAMLIPPGQPHRREATWPDLLRDIGNGKFRGIILLSAFGFHSLGDLPINQHQLYKGDANAFLVKFLEEMRKDEISILKSIAPHVAMNRRQQWLLSLVTKQDLWWKKHSDVETHYRVGEYGVEIDNIIKKTNPKLFRHELCFASLTISNLISGANELLQPNTEGYDHARQASSLLNLFKTIDALKTWELK